MSTYGRWSSKFCDATDTELSLEAWRLAKKTLKRYGVQTEGLIVHQDQDSVYLGDG